MKGKLIVLEGTDGTGKTTQVGLMAQRLEREAVPFRRVKFPRYGSPFAAPVERYLLGDLGTRPGDVSAYAASTLYAVDRYASYKEDWGRDYEAGELILANRYTTSNAVHQSSKLPAAERPEYVEWLFSFEYGRLGLPKPDLVVYLDMPTEVSRQMRRLREEVTGSQADIHEQDDSYQRQCREAAAEIARRYNWQVIACASDTTVRTPEDIHAQVLSIVADILA